MVMNLMQDLNNGGATIIFISHHMEEAAQARRMIVMDHGDIVMDGTPEEIFSHEADIKSLGLRLPPVSRLAIGLNRYFPNIRTNIHREIDLLSTLPGCVEKNQGLSNPAPELIINSLQIEVSHLEHIYLKGIPLQQLAVRDVSFQVGKGNSYGFMGHTGSGKSTVLQHLNALLRPQAGTVRVGDFILNDLSIDRKEVCRLAGLMFQNPEMQFFETYVGDEISFGLRKFGGYSSLADQVCWAMELVGLDFNLMKDRATYDLSGGERRKVALASVLAWKPGILLLDEPTAGLDPRSREELIQHLLKLKDQDITLVISSHQMEDLAALVESSTVFDRGRDLLNGPIWTVFQQSEVLSQAKLEPPVTVRVATGLRALGWSIPKWIINPEDLIQRMGVLSERI
jgi:energy-coupling factor transporter ATP-binding protein EcfA2